jgi:hypothetical protein
MLAADDGKISRTRHRQQSLSRLQPTEPMRQPLPTAVRVTRPDERPRTPPWVLAARQIDHICAPERWAHKETDGRAERRILRAADRPSCHDR